MIDKSSIMQSVCYDWYRGVIDSMRIDKVILLVIKPPFRSHFYHILIANTILYLIPYLLFGELHPLITTIINTASIIFHIFKYFDLVCVAVHLNRSYTKIYDGTEMLSLGLLMAIYQTVISLSLFIVSLVIYFPVEPLILLYYHSFYCFNNLWQCQGIPVSEREKRIERLWGYYSGFATISTVLYLLSNNLLICAIYNIYLSCNILTVFVIKSYPSHNNYPSINLSIFSWITKVIVHSLS